MPQLKPHVLKFLQKLSSMERLVPGRGETTDVDEFISRGSISRKEAAALEEYYNISKEFLLAGKGHPFPRRQTNQTLNVDFNGETYSRLLNAMESAADIAAEQVGIFVGMLRDDVEEIRQEDDDKESQEETDSALRYAGSLERYAESLAGYSDELHEKVWFPDGKTPEVFVVSKRAIIQHFANLLEMLRVYQEMMDYLADPDEDDFEDEGEALPAQYVPWPVGPGGKIKS